MRRHHFALLGWRDDVWKDGAYTNSSTTGISTLVSLLHDDAIQSMPPYAMWLRGSANIGRWFAGPGIGCQGSLLLPTSANGCPAFGQYRIDPEGGHKPWALQVLELSGDRISGFHSFLDTDLFAAFGLPTHLPA